MNFSIKEQILYYLFEYFLAVSLFIIAEIQTKIAFKKGGFFYLKSTNSFSQYKNRIISYFWQPMWFDKKQFLWLGRSFKLGEHFQAVLDYFWLSFN